MDWRLKDTQRALVPEESFAVAFLFDTQVIWKKILSLCSLCGRWALFPRPCHPFLLSIVQIQPVQLHPYPCRGAHRICCSIQKSVDSVSLHSPIRDYSAYQIMQCSTMPPTRGKRCTRYYLGSVIMLSSYKTKISSIERITLSHKEVRWD